MLPLLEPGPGVVAPGGHGLLDGPLATVVDVPAGCDGELPATVLEPVVLLPVEGLVLIEGVLPVVPLFVGVHGDATVGVVLVWFVPKVPVVPPVALPALPAVAGVPGVAAGVPGVLAPGDVVVGLCVVVVPGVVVPGVVLVAPG